MKTPYFLIDEAALLANLRLLREVAERAECRILLAQKAYSVYQTYPLIGQYLAGTAASGLYEARLGHEEMAGETHVYAPAFREEDIGELLRYADHFVLNSPAQVKQFAPRLKEAGKQVGLRLNPEHSTQEGPAIYDPCAAGSRLGTTAAEFDESILPLLDGFHMHTLCEQNSDALEETVAALEQKFGKYLSQVKWLNLGGGHHITRADYDIPRLVNVLRGLRDRYGLQLYLEPGEAVVYRAGELVTKVLDVIRNGDIQIAILDASAACHMPDVLEMPYRPPLADSGLPGEKKFCYRLAGPTCLAGDVIGDYSFGEPLRAGRELRFQDMALYTMVKTNTFNGMPLPDIVIRHASGELELIRSFGYENFKNRL